MTESPGSVFLDYSPSGVKIEVPGKLPSGKEIWKVEISGSFTSWRPGPSMRAEDGRFVLTLPSKKFAVPGNSGYPELTFLVNGRYWFGYDFLWEAPSLLFDRLVVLVPPEELPGWLGQKEKYNLWKEDYDEPGHLANTRQVRSERLALNLWRSYHPFLPSKISHPREMDRLSRVNLYLEAIRPGVIFNLSDKPQDLQSPLISPFYQSLWRQDRVKLLETSYEWVYYHSHEQDFFRYLARIVQVVFEHQGPYWIHCRLGVDRTGVICAILGLLGGLSIHEVIRDYLLSNQAGILEYRDAKLLRHSLERTLGNETQEGKDYGRVLWAKIQPYFESQKGEDLDFLRKRLQMKNEKT
jgi:protein-tyrosine phosphatase